MSPYSTQAPVLALAGATALTGALWLALRWTRADQRHRVRLLAWAMLAGWVLVVGVITLRPLDPQPFPATFHWTPFPSTGSRTEAVANIMMFIPAGAAIALLTSRARLLWTVASAGAISFGIELAQLIQNAGRVATITDVLLNTAGAAIGAALVAVAVAVALASAHGESRAVSVPSPH